MLDLSAATQATTRDLAAIIDRLDALADTEWNAPVRCQGWQVTDLAVHLAGASRGQADGLHRAATGDTSLALLAPPADRDPRSLIAALKDGQDKLTSALRELPPPALDGAVPLPFGLLPTAVALPVVALEYGFHRNDLDWALGDQVPLGPDISATLLGLLPGLLPMLAAGSPVHHPGATPPGPVSFRLVTPSARLLVSHPGAAEEETTGPGWSVTGGDTATATATCEIAGDDSPVALFVMGRIGAGHPDLTVSDSGAAQTFKRYFPGP